MDESGNPIQSIHQSKLALISSREVSSSFSSHNNDNVYNGENCNMTNMNPEVISTTTNNYRDSDSQEHLNTNYLLLLQSFIKSCWDPNYLLRPKAIEALQLFTMLEDVLMNHSVDNSNNVSRTNSGKSLMLEKQMSNGSVSNGDSSLMVAPTPTANSSMLVSQGDFNWHKQSNGIDTLNTTVSTGQVIVQKNLSVNDGTEGPTSTAPSTIACDSPTYLGSQQQVPLNGSSKVTGIANQHEKSFNTNTNNNANHVSVLDDRKSTSLFQSFKNHLYPKN